MSTAAMWEAIADAFDLIADGKAQRIDGAGWSVYAVGTLIRIDVREWK